MMKGMVTKMITIRWGLMKKYFESNVIFPYGFFDGPLIYWACHVAGDRLVLCPGWQMKRIKVISSPLLLLLLLALVLVLCPCDHYFIIILIVGIGIDIGIGIGIVPQPANENDKSNLSPPVTPSLPPSFLHLSSFHKWHFCRGISSKSNISQISSIFRQMFQNVSENFSMQNSGGKLIRDSQCETPLNSTLEHKLPPTTTTLSHNMQPKIKLLPLFNLDLTQIVF